MIAQVYLILESTMWVSFQFNYRFWKVVNVKNIRFKFNNELVGNELKQTLLSYFLL